MRTNSWTYMLRLMRRDPDKVRMNRLAEYMTEFARLLGLDNEPVLHRIYKRSVGIAAAVPGQHAKSAFERVHLANSDSESVPAKHARKIAQFMAVDGIPSAQMLDSKNRIIYSMQPVANDDDLERTVFQAGTVDGVVTGIVGADETMHLHLRDHLGHDLRIVVRDELAARSLLGHFRQGTLRIHVHGRWKRTSDGWIPETSKCLMERFEVLEETPVSDLIALIARIEGIGWRDLEDPIAFWRELRGADDTVDELGVRAS